MTRAEILEAMRPITETHTAGKRDDGFVEVPVCHINRLRRVYAALQAEPELIKETAMLRPIDERDEAEEWIGRIYFMMIGHSPEWSNNFGYEEAFEEIKDAKQLLGEAAKLALQAPPEPSEEEVNALLHEMMLPPDEFTFSDALRGLRRAYAIAAAAPPSPPVAGEGKAQIEVTKSMLEAGFTELSDRIDDADAPVQDIEEDDLAAIYRAMRAAAPAAGEGETELVAKLSECAGRADNGHEFRQFAGGAVAAAFANARAAGFQAAKEKAAEVIRDVRKQIGLACIGAAGAAQAEYERGIVSPYLDTAEDAIRALKDE